MPDCSFVLVTPAMAKEWLEVNRQNRTLSTQAVTRLAGIIQRGEWMPDSTDAIGLDTDGAVVNGQHRLSAVIEANTAVEMLVVRGVRHDVIKVIDQGRGRSFAQWLSFGGQYNKPADLAAAVTWLYRIIEGYEAKMPMAVTPSVPQLLDVLDAHKNVEGSVDLAWPTHKAMHLQIGWLAAYHYAMASASSERAEEFFAQLTTGEGLQAGDPAFVLRERYVTDWAAADSKKADNAEKIVWLVKAWNAFSGGQKITAKTLSYRRSGKFAETFPKVAGLSWLADDSQLES